MAGTQNTVFQGGLVVVREGIDILLWFDSQFQLIHEVGKFHSDHDYVTDTVVGGVFGHKKL